MAYPQTFKGVQDSVLAKLRMQDTTTNRSLVKDWINQSYAQAATETQVLQEAGYATLVPPDVTYTLPDHITELKAVMVKGTSDDAFGPPLERVSLETLLDLRQANGSTTGSPASYALLGLNQLELYPAPDSAGTIQFYYAYLPVALAVDADVPVFQEPYASKILEYGALAQGAEFIVDPLGPTWDAKFQDWKTRLRVHMNRRGGMVDQFPVFAGSNFVPHDRSVDTGW